MIFVNGFAKIHANTISAEKTLESYYKGDQDRLFYNRAFDISFAAVHTGVSLYGLSRFSKHQDESNAIYALNGIMGAMLLYRSFSHASIYKAPNDEIKKIKDPKLRERIAEYKLRELSNNERQLRRLSSGFGLVSSILLGVFSEGKPMELISSTFLAANSIFYLFFYSAYGEDAYDKYYFYKKAYPQVSYYKKSLLFTMNFKF